ncbi:MAG: ATP-binding protein [candidate division Zixibacteria bacterium]|nr:ATP-binding protein [candidate division Zixibacteria bacterium]
MISLKNLRPGLITRLSNLILLQFFFIFAVLTLLFFYPKIDGTEPTALGDSKYAADQLFGRVDSSNLALQNSAEAVDRVLGELINAEPTVDKLEIVALHPTGKLSLIHRHEKENDNSSDNEISLASLVGGNHNKMPDTSAPGFILSVKADPARSVHCYRLRSSSTEPLFLLLLTDDNLVVSSRTKLKYALMLLFLVSTLLSLLTIYLVNRRFKKPLETLMHGLEKTAEGEVFHLMESDHDNELKKLAVVFNKMSASLWEGHKRQKAYTVYCNTLNYTLLESQLFLATLIDSSPLSIIVTTPDGIVMLANRASSEAFGYKQEELIDKAMIELFDQSIDKEVTSEHESQGYREFEVVAKRSNGDSFPAFVIMTPLTISAENITAYLYILRDISESKGFQDMMIRLDRYYTRGEMAGDIAHEINNFLAILSGNIELMPLLLKKGDPEKITAKLEVMKTTTDKIARFANGLMDRPHEGTHPELTSLNQIVENIIAFLKPQKRFNHVHIGTKLSSDLPLNEVDQGQIQQLLVNLLYNACDALDEETGKREIRVVTSHFSQDNRDWVRVEVCDNGPGVPEDRIEMLFSNRFTTKRKGHGIGLTTCWRIVDAHGGKIAYRFSGGAVFYFDLPVSRTNQLQHVPCPLPERKRIPV